MIILDIDNCIADDSWRLDRIRYDNPDIFARYNDYHLASPRDSHFNSHIYRGLLPSQVAIFTARPERYRLLTQVWLDEHHIPFSILLMRPDADHRAPVRLKEEQLAWLLLDHKVSKYSITGAFDDRWDIMEMYRRNGIPSSRLFIQDRPEPHPAQLDLFEGL